MFAPAEIFQYAMQHVCVQSGGCTSAILAHNRPEGISLEPTERDFDVTNFLYHCVRYMNIEVLDHLIINLNTFISLYKNKKMIKIIESIKYKSYSEIKHIIDKRIEKALNDGRREGIVAGKFLGREEGLIEGEQIGIEKGKEEGIEIGFTEGFIEGEAKGIDKGKIIGNKDGEKKGKREEKIEIVKNLLSMNIDIETIMKATGLSKKEINALSEIKKDTSSVTLYTA